MQGGDDDGAFRNIRQVCARPEGCDAVTVPQSDADGPWCPAPGAMVARARAVVARSLGAPLHVQITVALCLGVVVGVWLGPMPPRA
jgi:hypothetical protein